MTRRPSILAAIGLAAAASVVAAQPPIAASAPAGVEWPRASREDEFSIATPSDGLRLEPPLVLVPVAESELDRDLLAKALVTTLRGFDAGRYGLSELSIHFGHRPHPDDDYSDTLDLYVSTRHAPDVLRWWHLRFAEGEHDRWFFRTDRIATSETADAAASPEPGVEAPAKRPAPAQVATSDPTMPLISVEFSSNPIFQRQTSHSTTHLLLDFRTATPRVAATLERSATYDCTGACAAYDCGSEPDWRVSCRWDPVAQDFACEEQFAEGRNDGGERTGTRWFQLLSGKRLPSPRARTGPLDLKPDVPVGRARVGDTQTLELLGPVTLAASLTVGGGRVWVLGLPRLKADFDVDFAIAPVAAGRRGRIQAVGSRFDVRSLPLEKGSEERTWSPYVSAGEPDGGFMPDAAPTFRVFPVASSGTLTVVRVLVTEGRTQTVHLVGVERTASGLVADVLPLATTGSIYAACANNLRPSTAVGMRLAQGPLRITLDIEPSHYWKEYEEDDQAHPTDGKDEFDCRGRVTMTWTTGQGFEPVSRTLRCDQPARRVVIDGAGSLSSRPVKKADVGER
jgi:hypothetical protein